MQCWIPVGPGIWYAVWETPWNDLNLPPSLIVFHPHLNQHSVGAFTTGWLKNILNLKAIFTYLLKWYFARIRWALMGNSCEKNEGHSIYTFWGICMYSEDGATEMFVIVWILLAPSCRLPDGIDITINSSVCRQGDSMGFLICCHLCPPPLPEWTWYCNYGYYTFLAYKQ